MRFKLFIWGWLSYSSLYALTDAIIDIFTEQTIDFIMIIVYGAILVFSFSKYKKWRVLYKTVVVEKCKAKKREKKEQKRLEKEQRKKEVYPITDANSYTVPVEIPKKVTTKSVSKEPSKTDNKPASKSSGTGSKVVKGALIVGGAATYTGLKIIFDLARPYGGGKKRRRRRRRRW